MTLLNPRTTDPLVGLCGGIGCGKSTAAEHLMEDYGFEELSFAQKLKDVCADLFNIPKENLFGTQEQKTEPIPHLGVVPSTVAYMGHPWGARVSQPWTGRWVLEWMGTNACRTVWEPVWIESVRKQVEDARENGYGFGNPVRHVVSDVRFQNEADMIRQLGGIVVRVEVEGASHETTGHASDGWYAEAEVDFVVKAPKPGLDILRGRLDEVMDRFAVERI